MGEDRTTVAVLADSTNVLALWLPGRLYERRLKGDRVMTRKIALLFVCIGFVSTQSRFGIAATDAVPKLNTRPSCESPARLALRHDHDLAIEACRRSEHAAYEDLKKHWAQYPKTDKTTCVGKVTQGGPPSYIELHSCFDTMRHARSIIDARTRKGRKL